MDHTKTKGPTSEVVKRLLLGRAVPSEGLEHTLLPKVLALPVFSSDALSSVAYATEEILRVLLIASVTGISMAMPIAGAIAVLLGRRGVLVPPDGARVPERRRLLHREQGEPRHVGRPAGRGGAADGLRADRRRVGGRRRVRVDLGGARAERLSGGARGRVRRADHADEPAGGQGVGDALRRAHVRVHHLDLHAADRRHRQVRVRRMPRRDRPARRGARARDAPPPRSGCS